MLRRPFTGANYDLSVNCAGLPRGTLKTFRTKQACTGIENSLIECGGVEMYEAIEVCACGAVAVITCQPAGKQDMGLYCYWMCSHLLLY